MSNLQKRIHAFVKLGEFLQFYSGKHIDLSENKILFDTFSKELSIKIDQSMLHNGWFTEENIDFALAHWGTLLSEKNIKNWLQNYSFEEKNSKKIAIIMAGNIPLVGLHDFICVLLTGHQVLVKQATSDKLILPVLASFLETVEPELSGKIYFTETILKDFDAVIATGSDNTARYFDYYFRKKPHIIRKNRNSVAILNGKETNEDLIGLGEDIFRYFGLGCRSVSKLFVPENYDFDVFFNAIYTYKDIIQHTKYANNYDYNKAVYLMSLFNLKDNGFLILKEDTAYASPIAVIFYEYYNSATALQDRLQAEEKNIQCIVSSENVANHISFGMSQKPSLGTYADGVDTVDFLLKI